MGFEAALHYSYANNLEQRAALQVLEGRASNLLLFPLLGRAAGSHQRTKAPLRLPPLTTRLKSPSDLLTTDANVTFSSIPTASSSVVVLALCYFLLWCPHYSGMELWQRLIRMEVPSRLHA